MMSKASQAATPETIFGPGAGDSAAERFQTARQWLYRYSSVVLLILMSTFFALAQPDRFGQIDTVRTLASTQVVLALVAIGVVFPLVAGEFDISVGATVGLSALVVARLDGPAGWPALAAVAGGLVVGLLVGLANGLLVAKLGLSSFIATLGVSVIMGGLAQWISGGITISGVSDSLTTAGRTFIGGHVPVVAVYLVAAAALCWFVLDMTGFGRHLRALGASPRSAHLSGLPVRRLRFSAFLLAGLMASIAGVLSTAKQGSAHPAFGPPLLLPAYAAAFLGATSISPGRFNVIGTVIAVFLIAVGITGIQMWGAPTWVEPVFNGAALLTAVAVSKAGRRAVLPA